MQDRIAAQMQGFYYEEFITRMSVLLSVEHASVDQQCIPCWHPLTNTIPLTNMHESTHEHDRGVKHYRLMCVGGRLFYLNVTRTPPTAFKNETATIVATIE